MHGCACAAFADTERAQAWLEENAAPDFVIINRAIEGPDVLDVCHSLRTVPRLAHIPFVVTGGGEQSIEDKSKAFDMAVALIAQPNDAASYRTIVERIVRNARRTKRWSPKPSLLIVDDDAGIREALCRVASDEGWEPVCAEDGEAALTICGSGAPAPSLALIDVMMPGVDGVQLARRLKVAPALRDTPLVLISAHNDIAANARKAGAVAHMKKPFEIDELMNLMQRAVLASAAS